MLRYRGAEPSPARSNDDRPVIREQIRSRQQTEGQDPGGRSADQPSERGGVASAS